MLVEGRSTGNIDGQQGKGKLPEADYLDYQTETFGKIRNESIILFGKILAKIFRKKVNTSIMIRQRYELHCLRRNGVDQRSMRRAYEFLDIPIEARLSMGLSHSWEEGALCRWPPPVQSQAQNPRDSCKHHYLYYRSYKDDKD